MDVHKQLIAARDRLVLPEDYGNIVPVREKYTEKMSPFPGGSGFLMSDGTLAGTPGEKRYMVIAHNYGGAGNLDKAENYKSAFWDASSSISEGQRSHVRMCS